MRWPVRVLMLCALGGEANAFTVEQVRHGRQLFARCVACHSLADDTPTASAVNRPLVGAEALPAMVEREFYPAIELGTVGALSDFIQLSMHPPPNPVTVREEEALALTALILEANGVPSDGRVLTRDGADDVQLEHVLPARRTRRRLGLIAATAVVAVAAGLVFARRRKERSR
jgi:hypothetical protein